MRSFIEIQFAHARLPAVCFVLLGETLTWLFVLGRWNIWILVLCLVMEAWAATSPDSSLHIWLSALVSARRLALQVLPWSNSAASSRWRGGFRVQLSPHQTDSKSSSPDPSRRCSLERWVRELNQPGQKLLLFFLMSCWLLQLLERRDRCLVSGYQCQRCSPAQPRVGWREEQGPHHVPRGLWAGKRAQPHHKTTCLRLLPLNCI